MMVFMRKRNFRKYSGQSRQRQGGFTLIEVLIVVVIIGILGSIAAPGWLGFVNQQRVNKANEVVLRGLQSAQSEARKTKLNYSFALKMETGRVPEFATFPDPTGTTEPSNWKSIGADIGLSPGQVWVGTNLAGQNESGGAVNVVGATPTGRITFDHTGVLQSSNRSPDVDLRLVTAQPGGGTDPAPGTLRCVKITTLLGSIETYRTDAICKP